MAIDVVKLGQTVTISSNFYNSDGSPFIPINPASYKIIDFNNTFITSGIAEQDTVDSSLWSASISIPISAPYSSTEKYQIQWQIINDKTTLNQSEYFNVEVPNASEVEYQESDTVILNTDVVSDNLILDASYVVTQFAVRVLDTAGNVYYQDTNNAPTTLNIEGQNTYQFVATDGTTLPTSFDPYLVEWKFTVNGNSKREYHFIYVTNFRIILLMEKVRQLIDKARFDHPNVNLRYNDVDLYYYLTQGVQIINLTKPMLTNFTLLNFPNTLDWFLTNAAAYVALSAQYLAEGVAAFDFSGQAVTLNVDRTATIDAALGRVLDVIQNQLPLTKKMIAMSHAGVLGITDGPTLNPNFMPIGTGSGYDNGFVGDFVTRNGMYLSVLSSFYQNSVTGY